MRTHLFTRPVTKQPRACAPPAPGSGCASAAIQSPRETTEDASSSSRALLVSKRLLAPPPAPPLLPPRAPYSQLPGPLLLEPTVRASGGVASTAAVGPAIPPPPLPAASTARSASCVRPLPSCASPAVAAAASSSLSSSSEASEPSPSASTLAAPSGASSPSSSSAAASGWYKWRVCGGGWREKGGRWGGLSLLSSRVRLRRRLYAAPAGTRVDCPLQQHCWSHPTFRHIVCGHALRVVHRSLLVNRFADGAARNTIGATRAVQAGQQGAAAGGTVALLQTFHQRVLPMAPTPAPHLLREACWPKRLPPNSRRSRPPPRESAPDSLVGAARTRSARRGFQHGAPWLHHLAPKSACQFTPPCPARHRSSPAPP